jgi:hypothetical protein
MAGDVYVSFGADTGELEGAFARARADARGLTSEINSLARETRARRGPLRDYGSSARRTSIASAISLRFNSSLRGAPD